MAASFTLPTVLANLAAGNQALSLIDGDFNTLAAPLLSLNTFSNGYQDTGGANAYVITVSSPQTVSQAQFLRVQFLAANANTGASTLQINALAAKNIKNLNGTALAAGQIPANGIADVMYDGTQYLLLNPVSQGFSKSFTSSVQTITSAGALTLAHGLGASPTLTQCRLKAINAVLGYSVGDEAPVDTMGGQSAANRGVSVVPDATNVTIRFGSDALAFSVIRKDTGVAANITNTDWNFIVRAWV